MHKRLLITGAALAGFGVAIGAFGAHGLREILEANGRVATFETGVRYHMYHAIALLIVGILNKLQPNKLSATAGLLFFLGILFFSGSLYTMSITGINWLGAITPIGGVLFISGWTSLILYLIRNY
jgi:uncharacterized membrane protein YgdD (TMEM256/DUF423 family)